MPLMNQHTIKAESLFQQKEYNAVVKLLENYTDDAALRIRAFAFQKLGEWDAAMELWNLLIARNETTADFYLERGVCKFNLKFKHAIQDFDKAISLDSSNPYFYSCRAYIKDKIGDTEGSIEDYEAARKLDPTDAIILNNLGLAEQKLGHTSKARAIFKESDAIMGIDTFKYETQGTSLSTVSKRKSKTLLMEVKKMISSKEGFMTFLRELRGR